MVAVCSIFGERREDRHEIRSSVAPDWMGHPDEDLRVSQRWKVQMVWWVVAWTPALWSWWMKERREGDGMLENVSGDP